jgi:tetratricopeptide (TPR) repeat protein
VLAAAQEAGNRYVQCLALSNLGHAHSSLGRADRAVACLRQAGDRHGEAEILRDLGDLSRDAGHVLAARRFWGQALDLMDDLGDAPACADIRGRLDPPGLTGT